MSIFGSGTTQSLMDRLSKTKDLASFVGNSEVLPTKKTFADFINIVIQSNNIKKSHIISKADIEKVYAYEIFRGVKKPKRNIALRILISLDIEIEDIQYVLKNSGYEVLYPKNIRDAAIIFSIKNKYDVIKVNELLYDMECECI